MHTSVAIHATNLSVVREGHTILSELSFEVRAGAITGLIGPSGSGKTTLLRSIVGLQRYAGSLQVGDKSSLGRPDMSRIGYVSQRPSLYVDLTVGQNIQYFQAVTGASQEQAQEVLSAIELTTYETRLVGSLSGGQQARVSLAVALLGNPKLLVLDEPTVGLDPLLRRSLWGLFRRLVQAGATILVSSHVMDEAERCEDVLLMRDGELLWSGSRTGLLARTGEAQVEDAFIHMVEGE